MWNSISIKIGREEIHVNFTGIKFNKSENNRVLNPSHQSTLKYTKNLTQDTVSFKGYPGDSRERDLFEGLKCRNPLRQDQLEKEGFNYQSPFIPDAIKYWKRGERIQKKLIQSYHGDLANLEAILNI